jgi:hypothetical protein
VDIPKTKRVADLTVEELMALWEDKFRAAVRESVAEILKQPPMLPSHEDLFDPNLDNFPVDHFDSWPEDMTFRREEMYDDDGR